MYNLVDQIFITYVVTIQQTSTFVTLNLLLCVLCDWTLYYYFILWVNSNIENIVEQGFVCAAFLRFTSVHFIWFFKFWLCH